ncbi:MAG: helix-turn-helix transcriptional regulator [Lachnospiraceae bacterium]|nr:helix-turn-helix transcriptional regulator [Lachnospiraceae bacterium]
MEKLLYHYVDSDLRLRHAVDEVPDKNDFTMHVHEHYEIYLFISGHAKYIVEGSVYPLEPGTVIIIRPTEIHKAEIIGEQQYERYSVNFSTDFLENIDPEHRLMKAFDSHPHGLENMYHASDFVNNRVYDTFKQMCSAGSEDDYDKRLRIYTGLFSLLEEINTAYINRNTQERIKPPSQSEQIVRYVNKHLFEELSVPIIAEKFHMSTSQLSRIFKKGAGCSIWEYISAKRLSMARIKIHNGMNAQTAGEECGFKDYSSFYRSYVKRYGVSPKYDDFLPRE